MSDDNYKTTAILLIVEVRDYSRESEYSASPVVEVRLLSELELIVGSVEVHVLPKDGGRKVRLIKVFAEPMTTLSASTRRAVAMADEIWAGVDDAWLRTAIGTAAETFEIDETAL